MEKEADMSRRLFMGTTVAASALLAGCSGSGGTDTTEPTATATATDTATETTTPTETPTPEPTTVETFSYPKGASLDGVDSAQLFSTHRSSITDAGSATVSIARDTDRGDYSSSANLTNTFSPSGILRIKEGSSLTERLWSPAEEDSGYVQMDTGFEQRYRIVNRAPRPPVVLRLPVIERLLEGAEWGEAAEVVETDAGEAVVYETSGIRQQESLFRVVFGDEVTDFTASLSVTSDGVISEISYDMTVERERNTVRQEATIATGMVGETTIEEPSWSETAREEGVKFSIGVAEDDRMVTVELETGELPSASEVQLSTRDGYGRGSLGQSMAAGDTLYLSFSQDETLLLGINEPPSEYTDLGRFVFVTLRDGPFSFLEQSISL